LCGDNYCNPIDSDTELPLLRDYGHVNILGLRRFRPLLDKLARKALNLTCNDYIVTRADYWNIHVQIYKNEKNTSEEIPQKPNVHIILIDSVSHPQMIRSLPKTMNYLRREFGIISFPFLNVNGRNSQDNGFAAFLGKQVDKEWHKKRVYPFRKKDYKNFSTFLDDDQYIGSIFGSAGYVTNLCESFHFSVFAKFKGFTKLPADHSCNPAGVLIEGRKKEIFQDRCDMHHTYQLRYLKNFIKTYENKSKFSLTWSTQLTHDDINALYLYDEEFLGFFESIKEELHNSYLFFMSDHGARYGDFREVAAGHREQINPALFIAP
ncbi:hypothetical protein FO519_010092, partial [Halicephalobus sp. NKZ332]